MLQSSAPQQEIRAGRESPGHVPLSPEARRSAAAMTVLAMLFPPILWNKRLTGGDVMRTTYDRREASKRAMKRAYQRKHSKRAKG
jgi:hypothetical protein